MKRLDCQPGEIGLSLGPDMQIGIVSDTHGNLRNSAKAVEILKSLGIRTVLHCGDIGSAYVPSEFADFEAHYVFGNVDTERDLLRAAIADVDGICHDRFGELELDGRRIAFLHGDDERRLKQTIEDGEYDLVCSGHTHVAESNQAGETLALNPGALHRANPHSLAIVELGDLSVEIVPLPRTE